MDRLYWGLIGSFSLATVCCVFGQGMAYFLSEHIVPIYPVYYLTALTVIGISLYAVSGLLLFMLFKRMEFSPEYRELYMISLIILAPAASLWAFFVTAMWWG